MSWVTVVLPEVVKAVIASIPKLYEWGKAKRRQKKKLPLKLYLPHPQGSVTKWHPGPPTGPYDAHLNYVPVEPVDEHAVEPWNADASGEHGIGF